MHQEAAVASAGTSIKTTKSSPNRFWQGLLLSIIPQKCADPFFLTLVHMIFLLIQNLHYYGQRKIDFSLWQKKKEKQEAIWSADRLDNCELIGHVLKMCRMVKLRQKTSIIGDVAAVKSVFSFSSKAWPVSSFCSTLLHQRRGVKSITFPPSPPHSSDSNLHHSLTYSKSGF